MEANNMKEQEQEQKKELTPMEEFLSHLKSVFGYYSPFGYHSVFGIRKIDEQYWLEKEKKSMVKSYNEGVEDGGFFGNGNDYFDRNFKK